MTKFYNQIWFDTTYIGIFCLSDLDYHLDYRDAYKIVTPFLSRINNR